MNDLFTDPREIAIIGALGMLISWLGTMLFHSIVKRLTDHEKQLQDIPKEYATKHEITELGRRLDSGLESLRGEVQTTNSLLMEILREERAALKDK